MTTELQAAIERLRGWIAEKHCYEDWDTEFDGAVADVKVICSRHEEEP